MECADIEGVSLHYKSGVAIRFMKWEVSKLSKSLSENEDLVFSAINLSDRTVLIIQDIQLLFYLLGMKTVY